MASPALPDLRAALEQRGLPLAQQPDEDVLEMMLSVEDGDVEGAAQAICDAQMAERRGPTGRDLSRPPVIARQDPARVADRVPAAQPSWLWALWRVVSYPLSVLGTALLLVWRLFHRRPPGGGGEQYELSRFSQDPAECAQRWIDTLERDTGGTASADAIADDRVPLPPFTPTSYADALRRVKDELRILVVVLTSRAHSDDHLFRTQVLADRALVRTLSAPDLLVWGGDIRDRDTYQVATLLEASTYPFVAFIALQPRRSRSRGAVVPHPAVLSRLEGSPRTVLSAPALVAHITDVILPRTHTYLTQLRRERQQREQDRALREEQDRAYDAASRRDMERVLKRREDEQHRAAEADLKAAEEASRQEALQATARWRRWAHAHLVPHEPSTDLAMSIRVSVKLPDGRNLQRRFRPSDTLEHLYAYVDTIDAHTDEAPVSMPSGYEHKYAFQLVQTYPRRLLARDQLSTTLQEMDGFGPSATLIVESDTPWSEATTTTATTTTTTTTRARRESLRAPCHSGPSALSFHVITTCGVAAPGPRALLLMLRRSGLAAVQARRWAVTHRSLSGSAVQLRETRVGALDFRLSTKDAVYRARLAALEQLLPTIKGRWGGIAFALMQAFGLGWLTDSEEQVMRHVSSRAVYYPLWVVDAHASVKCRGDQGEATATFVTTSSAMPGNSYAPLSALPLRPPPPRTAELPEGVRGVITAADEPMEYTPFSRARHLRPDVSIDGGVTVLPFNLSPLALSDLGKASDLKSSMIDLLDQNGGLQIHKRFMILPGVEIQLANQEAPREDGAKAVLRVEWDSLDVRAMACYPVLLPLHLVQFEYDTPEASSQRATVALGAWDESLLAYAVMSDEAPEWKYKGESAWLDIDMIDFAPRVPVAPSLLDPSAGEEVEHAGAHLVHFMAQQTQLQNAFEARAQSWVDQGSWSFVEAWQRDHVPSSDAPEAEAGLGQHIAWDDSAIRRVDEDMVPMRRYLALCAESIFSSRLLDDIERDRAQGKDVSQVQTLKDGDLMAGDDAIRVLHERLDEMRAKRDACVPPWLK